MAKGAFAGNVNCKGNYKTGTAGLDCAGFVSACAELGARYSTYDIKEDHSYSIDKSDLQYMDIWIVIADIQPRAFPR